VVLTRTSTTLTVLAIIIVGTLLQINGQATIGEMVTFMNFAGLIIARLEGAVGFISRVMSEAPRLREFFEVCDTVPAIRDAGCGRSRPPQGPRRVQGRFVLV